MKKRFDMIKFVELAILLAIVVVFQLVLGSVRVGPTSFSVVLIPIVIGSLLLGPLYGAILGFAFGLITLFAGIFGTDVFTATLFQYSPVGTSVICIAKATLAGLVPGYLYKLLKKKNEWFAVILAAISAPIVNTGLFIIGSLVFVKPAIEAYLIKENISADAIYFLFILCAGINFLVEFAVNAVMSPVVFRVIRLFDQKR